MAATQLHIRGDEDVAMASLKMQPSELPGIVLPCRIIEYVQAEK